MFMATNQETKKLFIEWKKKKRGGLNVVKIAIIPNESLSQWMIDVPSGKSI